MLKIEKPVVCMDLDGVLVDFVGGLHRALGLNYDVADYPYPAGKYEMFPDAIAATRGRHTLDSLTQACHTSSFWENLLWDPLGKQLLSIVEKYSDNIYLVSYPMNHTEAWVGKLRWIAKNLPSYQNRVILMTAHKKLLANPRAIIIDDRDDNVDKFVDAGGAGFLVPQMWNSKHRYSHSDWTVLLDSWMNCACKMI